MTPLIKVLRLTAQSATQYRALMLEAYARHPESFTSSPAERAALPLPWWETRLQTANGPGDVIFGAWDGETLVGVVGLSFESREKVRHKATLIGMYVQERCRGRGVGHLLVTNALQFLDGRPEVKVVQLTVTAGNAAAQALYQRFGFIQFGIEPMAVAVAGGYVSKVHMWRTTGVAPSPGKRGPELISG